MKVLHTARSPVIRPTQSVLNRDLTSSADRFGKRIERRGAKKVKLSPETLNLTLSRSLVRVAYSALIAGPYHDPIWPPTASIRPYGERQCPLYVRNTVYRGSGAAARTSPRTAAARPTMDTEITPLSLSLFLSLSLSRLSNSTFDNYGVESEEEILERRK